jgi:hypothetical protein
LVGRVRGPHARDRGLRLRDGGGPVKFFLAFMAIAAWIAAIVFGVLAMQGEALHAVSCIVMLITGFCFAAISRVGG